MKLLTLLLLRKNDHVLLAMKKRGFGEGLWNGVGGKIDSGETIEQAMIRECQEEINVTPTLFEPVARHDFYEFHAGEQTHMRVYVYTATAWKGEPVETEEMRPQWFALNEIPYSEMWPDDKYWLPEVLTGKKLHCVFHLNDKDVIEQYEIAPVDNIEVEAA